MDKGRCKFNNGTFHNDVCDAGIRYRDVVTEPDRQEGIAWRYPCTDLVRIGTDKRHSAPSASQLAEYAKRGTCPKYAEPTDDEIAAHEAEVETHMQKFRLTLPLISKAKKEHKGTDWKGVETCPACGGRLHMTHSAYNGHVWGQCETEGCLNWME